MATADPDRGLKWYAAREPIILGVLTMLAFIGFAGVSALSRLYHRDQEARGARWYTRGMADLQAANPSRAVADFRIALLFSPSQDAYEMGLAQALEAQGGASRDEANVYLLDLWEREPQNGTVNLALARIAAAKGNKEQALRYYHNAIYALWNDHPDAQRRAARLELAEFLLRERAATQAQAELIALSGDLPPDPAVLVHVGDLFAQAQDYDHANFEYQQALKIDRQNPLALAGVGRAAFGLGNYASAQHSLQEAEAAGADGETARLLETVNLVLQFDPFQRRIPASQRAHIVVRAFGAAGQRLKECVAPPPSPPSESAASGEATLNARWMAMKPKISEAGLRRDPDAIEAAMDLVFTIERQTGSACGTPTGPDLALLLVSKLHEGN